MAPKKTAQQPPAPVEDDDDLALWNNDTAPRRAAPVAAPSSSDDTSSSDNQSIDSATRRARDAAARVQDFGDISSAVAAAPAALPSVNAAFTAVAGPPSFLDPEAIRKLPLPETLGSDRAATIPISATNAGTNKRGQTAGTWDISQMAPKLKGEVAPEAGVVSGKAVRYRGGEEGEGGGGGGITAAQVAMLGGNLDGPSPAAAGRDRGKASKAMPVDEFLEKGVGGAQLPRKRQERKDREKDKRQKGQSTHAEWKSEAEMALRQQYD